jgi:hypothetical protein
MSPKGIFLSPDVQRAFGIFILTFALLLSAEIEAAALHKQWQKAPGSDFFLPTNSAAVSVAYNPYNERIIVASSWPSNGLHVLDASNGGYLWSLNLPTGASELRAVACAFGFVYACAGTTNGTAYPLKVFAWYDDTPDTAPGLVWSGDPGSGQPDAWGDSLDARGFSEYIQLILGSRSSRSVCIVNPTHFPLTAVTVNIVDAQSGNFQRAVWGNGVAYQPPEINTFWGKATGLALREVRLDEWAGTGAVARSFSNLPALSAIGFDAYNQYLAGLSQESLPHTINLFDARFGSPLPQLGSASLSTTNDNPEAIGVVRFGLAHSGVTKLFVLDSDNSLTAFDVAPRLHFEVQNQSLTLSWRTKGFPYDGPFTLQARPTFEGGGWTNVTRTTPYAAPSNAVTMFYRLSIEP